MEADTEGPSSPAFGVLDALVAAGLHAEKRELDDMLDEVKSEDERLAEEKSEDITPASLLAPSC